MSASDSDPESDSARGGNLPLKVLVLALVSAAFGYLVAAGKVNMGLVPGCIVGGAIFGIGLFALLKLSGVPRALWLTFGLKMVTVTAYKILNVVLVTWCMKDLGLSDPQAQSVYMVWGVFILVATLLSGSLTDALGIRRTLLTGLALCVIFRMVMFMSTDPWIALVCGMVPVAVGEAFCTPVLVAATRKFTAPEQRSVAFSIFYALMNAGFMVAYFFRDAAFTALPPDADGMVSLGGMAVSQERLLIFVSMAVELLMLPFLLLLREERTAAQDANKLAGHGMLTRLRLTLRDTTRETGRHLAGLVRHKGFHRLLIFLALIGLLKIVFNAMDAVLPTFAEREIGPEGKDRVGRFNAVNSLLILVLAPLVGTLTRRFSAYSMVIIGGFVTALSFVFMALPGEMFTALADGPLGEWVGHGYLGLPGAIHPYIVMIVLWQVAFSIGEALYSPRVYEYAASIAPKGQEASFASLSYVPLLMGKLATGAAFGGLMERYCPATGPRDPGTLWGIVGGLVLIAPILLLVLQRYVRVEEEGRSA
jgi:MFS family permease